MSIFFPKRATEGLSDSLAASGAGGSGIDPIDPGDVGYRRAGSGRREIPLWTLSKSRTLSVHNYRTNPMARAIVDTYTSFCVGDRGLTLQGLNPDVRAVADAFWRDPRNKLGDFRLQELLLRSHLLMGETALELMVGELTGVTRYSYIDPEQIVRIELDRGNPLWPATVVARSGDGIDEIDLDIMRIDDLAGLRSGTVLFEASWKALAADRRGFPFLSPILDWLDGYDQVLWNLVDRTALARYLVWDVEVKGDQRAIDDFIAKRGGTAIPRSGTVEVHNESVAWTPKTAQLGSYEDRVTGQSILTSVAAGAGLAKTWLAEPEDANRATSITMAEPVRRRVGGVQELWLAINTELVRFAVDRAVAAGQLAPEVEVKSEKGTTKMLAADTVSVTGPEIATSDAKVAAEILTNLSTSVIGLVEVGLLSEEAGKVAVKKGWEDFVGIPYSSELDDPSGARKDDLEEVLDETKESRRGKLGILVG